MIGYHQPDLFDGDAATAARDAGIAQVGEHAPADWSARAFRAVRECAAIHREFIVDQVWHYLAPADVPSEPRAMGAIMRAARELGLIEPTGRYALSERRTAHRNPRQIWKATR